MLTPFLPILCSKAQETKAISRDALPAVQVALQGKGETGALATEIVERLVRSGGLGALYRGFPVLSSMVASEKFLYYYVYTYGKKKGATRSLAGNILLGYVADIARLPVTMPLDLLSTRMQTSTAGSLREILNAVLVAKGVRGFYSGWSAYLVLALKPAIQILIFERLKALINRRAGRSADSSLTFREAFIVGALARMVATLICYPFFFLRISAQSHAHQGGLAKVAWTIWQEQGLRGFYAGMVSELTRGMIFHAVNMASMEVLRDTNRKLLLPKPKPQ